MVTPRTTLRPSHSRSTRTTPIARRKRSSARSSSAGPDVLDHAANQPGLARDLPGTERAGHDCLIAGAAPVPIEANTAAGGNTGRPRAIDATGNWSACRTSWAVKIARGVADNRGRRARAYECRDRDHLRQGAVHGGAAGDDLDRGIRSEE